MKSIVNRLTFILSLCLLFGSSTFAQEQDPEGMMNAWMESIKPGEAHAFLAKMEGKWTYTNSFWMAPGTEPQVSQGKCERKMIMGGRYLLDETSGVSFGMPMEGLQILGYDNNTEQFVSSWIDNMGTGILNGAGGWMEANASIDLRSTYHEPMSNMDYVIRQVTKMTDKNHFVFEYYMQPEGGQEFLSMKIEYERMK